MKKLFAGGLPMKKNDKGFSAIALLIILGLIVAGGIYVAVKKPPMYRFIEDKIRSIITPKPPIGELTPTRELEGTWVSSLSGKGFQLYGQFSVPNGTAKVYEDGDMELKIDRVENNIAYGEVRYSNMRAYGDATVSVPGGGTISTPIQIACAPDTGFIPTQIRVSGSALDFGTINFSGGTFTMQGTYTTDLMSGTMTTTISAGGGSGVIKGEFHLNRKR